MIKCKLLAFTLLLSLATGVLCSCGDKTGSGDFEYNDPYSGLDYEEKSQKLYDDILGDFHSAYEVAKQAKTDSERYALMAIAEAKLLESCVMLPTTAKGGNYAISRVAPYTAPFALWGNDSYRFHSLLVANKLISQKDRDIMKSKWSELKGTGKYYAFAKEYLAANGYGIKNEYTLSYASDPKTWDVLATAQATDTEALVNTYDGLMEYNCEGTLRPALASSYSVSEDGLTYTFILKKNVSWVDSQGRKIATVRADDFVAGLQHMMDVNDDLAYLVSGVIENAEEYISGSVTDISEVGVKAIDDTTLTYTLTHPISYFPTMLTYGVFAPLCREYYISRGGKFGSELDTGSASYNYGKTPNDIAYCGPYLVSSQTAENSIVFSANPSYWNSDATTIKKIVWLYNDGKDASRAYRDTLAGTLDSTGLNSTALELAKKEKPKGQDKSYFELYGYVSETGATTFSAFYNVNRTVLKNVSDGGAASSKNESEKIRATAALRNADFRLALSTALDRGAYNATAVGEELKLTSLRNTYTPGNFVYLTESVTLKMGDTETVFKSGTAYGEIVQAQLTADGFEMKVWDPKAEGGVGSSDGFDGWYNAEAARAALARAIEQLKKDGIEISAENPIYLDYPSPVFSPVYLNKANAYKQSIEGALGGLVVFNTVSCPTADDWYNAGYYTTVGEEANYDIYDLSGWGPDYGDPATYLDTFLPGYLGYMTKCIGIF